MGKLKGAVKFTGKLNDVVGYKVGNALNESYGVRNHQPTVSNPKSVAQAKQRMKTVAALNFYKAFAEILDHSWEGVKYGARSYSEFLKRAMLLESGYPFQAKGSKKFVPGEFAVADGSLTPIIVSENEVNQLKTSLRCLSTNDGLSNTIAVFSQNLLSQNGWLEEGDQITFVLAIDLGASGIYVPQIARFIIDTESTATMSTWRDSQGIVLDGTSGNVIPAPWSINGNVIACAVILSRPPRNVGGAWRRSPATMACIDAFKGVWMGDQRYMIAEHSFTTKQASVGTSPYYLNQGNNGDGNASNTVSRTIVNAQSEVTGASSAFLVENGVSRLIVAKQSNSARVTTYYQYNNVSNLSPVSVTDAINYDEETMVLIETVQNYFPNITTYSGGNNDPIEDRP